MPGAARRSACWGRTARARRSRSQAESVVGSRSPGRWQAVPTTCCSTSRSPASIPRRWSKSNGWCLTNRGIGVLITDHNVRETLDLTDRSYIIYSGRVLMEGRKDDIVNDPEVRRFYLGEDFRL